jgi:hypothetical protein
MHYVFSWESEFDKQKSQYRHHYPAAADTKKASEKTRYGTKQQKAY